MLYTEITYIIRLVFPTKISNKKHHNTLIELFLTYFNYLLKFLKLIVLHTTPAQRVKKRKKGKKKKQSFIPIS